VKAGDIYDHMAMCCAERTVKLLSCWYCPFMAALLFKILFFLKNTRLANSLIILGLREEYYLLGYNAV
jgi:hypothetical protein